MKSNGSRLTLGLSVLVTIAALISFMNVRRFHARGCDLEDGSYAASYGNCGNTEWELVAILAGSNYYDEGSEWAYGACAGNYFGCDGYVGSYTVQGNEQLEPAGFNSGEDAWQFYWELDDWVVQNQNETCSDGSKATTQSVVNYPYSTPTFTGWCNYE